MGELHHLTRTNLTVQLTVRCYRQDWTIFLGRYKDCDWRCNSVQASGNKNTFPSEAHRPRARQHLYHIGLGAVGGEGVYTNRPSIPNKFEHRGGGQTLNSEHFWNNPGRGGPGCSVSWNRSTQVQHGMGTPFPFFVDRHVRVKTLPFRFLWMIKSDYIHCKTQSKLKYLQLVLQYFQKI